MRAAYYEVNGPARDVLRVGDVATPQPGPGEVRVRLRTSGVNPSDVKSRAGATRKISYPRLIPHSDGAGDIDAVGAGVAAARVGERVWVWNAQWRRADGTAAEYVVLPTEQAVALPAHIGYAAGACLGIPAMTAYHAVALTGADDKSTVLIAGGAGAVGHYAIQFAKARHASVITTVSSAEKAEVARGAGADHAIDYKSEDVGARVMEITGRRGVDATIELDVAANAKLLPGVLRPKGKVVIYGTGGAEAALPAYFCLVNSISLQFFLVYELSREERDAAVSAITGMLESNRLVHNVALTLDLDRIVEAHEAVESGRTIGNVVLQMNKS